MASVVGPLVRSPVPPLLGAAAVLLARPAPRGAAAWCVVAASVWYAAWLLWRWWSALEISIDGQVYKESASAGRAAATTRAPTSTAAAAGGSGPSAGGATTASRAARRRRGPESLDGFSTPLNSEAAEDSPEAHGPLGGALPSGAEWAPFSPSLPYGVQPPQSNRAAPVPYWLECDASVFDVRNIRYKATREKVSSDFALYDCVGMDMIRDRRRIDGVVESIPAGAGLPSSAAGAPEWSPTWGVPRVLIFNCQVPYKAGFLFGAHPEDDGGLSVCNYFVLSKRACELLASGQATPAIGLWRRFVEEGVSTKEGVPLKVVGRIEDLESYEVPETFHHFNNKPVLLTKSARVITSRLPEVIEIDYDVRVWGYAARQALANYHHRAAEAELEIGYLVEGKTDDELPEQILGCFKLNSMDITQAMWVSIV